MISIIVTQNHPTLVYAGRELCKYLDLMTGEPAASLCTSGKPDITDGIYLEVSPERFSVADPELDDAVFLDLHGGKGLIAGSNPRAVLLGVYRALRALGCRFVRPGADGEQIPSLALSEMNVSLMETASFRHRGTVIEGADSLQNVLDYIEWMPKVGYNSFFTQFMDLSCFFKRWYEHPQNPYLAAEPFDETLCKQYEAVIWQEIARRSLLHHAVGHGWTTEPLGIEGRGWDEVGELTISPENRELLAMINGERGLFQNVASTTNLCYSNPLAREKICDYAVQYLRNHPGVRYLHLWLADSIHSFCECDACRQKSPADWYVLLLNELDERLANEQISTRIVFLLYYDLLFPPEKETFRHKDRFVMMFAPISRPFSQSFADFSPSVAPAPYELNSTPIPRTIEENLGCLEAWKAYLAKEGQLPDSFDFDYYMGRAHYGDPGYCAISKIIDRDIDHLPTLGLNGILSCQELRVFYPTGLPSYLLGLKLWDSRRTYDEIADEYFTAAYGEKGGEVRALLEAVSNCFDTDFWFRGKPALAPERAAQMEKAFPLAESIKALSQKSAPRGSCEQTSFNHLKLYDEYLTLYTKALICCAQDDPAAGKTCWEQFNDFLSLHENALQPAMDAYRIDLIARNSFFRSTGIS